MWGPTDINSENSPHDEQYSLPWLFKQQRLLALAGLLRRAMFSPNFLASIPYPSSQNEGSPPRRQDLYPSEAGSERNRSMVVDRHTQMRVWTWAERRNTPQL